MMGWEVVLISIGIVEAIFLGGVYLISKCFDWYDRKYSTRVVPV